MQMSRKKNLPKLLFELSGTFEFELLVELLLRYWPHPLADDVEYRNGLIDAAAEVLLESSRGVFLMEAIPPRDMNIVAAVWYAEHTSLQTEPPEDSEKNQRLLWLIQIRKALPSCFCDQSML